MLTNYFWGNLNSWTLSDGDHHHHHGGGGGGGNHYGKNGRGGRTNRGGGGGGGKRTINDISALIRDEEEKDLEDVDDLDELADRLLTQFPAYGTNHNHHSSLSQEDDDWLLNDDDIIDGGGGGGGGGTGSHGGTTPPSSSDRNHHYQNPPPPNIPYHHSILHHAGVIPSSLLMTDSRLNQAFPGMMMLTTSTSPTTTSAPTSPAAASGTSTKAGAGAGSNSNNNSNNNATNVELQRHSDWDIDEQYLWKAVGAEEEKSNHHHHHHHRRLSLQDGSHHHHHDPKQQQQQKQWMYGRNSNYHQNAADAATASSSSSAFPDSRPYNNNINQSSNESISNNNNNNTNHSTTTAAITTAAGGGGGAASAAAAAQDYANSRQHWMPDQLCKHCYACDTPFTVFRRRHHCRICGQVFCSSCSAYFVPSDHRKKNSSTLRTCQMCYDQVTQKGGLLLSSTARGEGGGFGGDGGIDGGNEDNNNNNIKQDANTTTTSGGNNGDPNTNNNNNNNNHLSISASQIEGGRPVITDHKTLTIQTSPSALRSTKIGGEGKDPPVPPAAATGAVAAAKARRGGNNPGDPKKLLPQPSPQDIMTTTTTAAAAFPTDTHWRAAEATAASDAPAPPHSSSSQEAKRHLGLTAASHLENMGEALLTKDAPLLWEEIVANCQKQHQQQHHHHGGAGAGDADASLPSQIKKEWLDKLMTLATRCCATVEPNVKKGDLLDIRPYVKIKVIPGGSFRDCAYLSGIVFRKTVSHKRMAKEIHNPRIMLLSGGIEFTRTENRFASLHTLLEQEGKYMEILVGRILKLKPDVLCVGRSVSRRALELFLKANVVLIQHVKSTLMSRISRQTGATIISSTDHIMNQFGANVLGECNRFRLVTFRDNEVWVDPFDTDEDIWDDTSTATNNQRSIKTLLKTPDLSNHERQAALAANVLGDGVVDGAEAIKAGLSKRGVAQTFVMLEGCPKHLGCSVVLRGASRAALKQVKRVFRFLVNVAYNLRLEMSYLKERCARIRPDFHLEPKHIFSSSLCVDYGSPPPGRKMVRPWNGGTSETSQKAVSGEITAFDHQSILITSVWMTETQQCCPAEVKGICYYSLQDVSLGQFLRDSCFNLDLKCQNPACKKSVDDHSLLFVHKDGVIKITVEHMQGPLPSPSPPSDGKGKMKETSKDKKGDKDEADSPIATWTFCKHCERVVTPLVYISEETWKFSFGKFLEVFFYNRDAVMNSPEYGCSCPMQTGTMLYFGCGKLAARFSYERVRPLGVFVRKSLPIDTSYHRKQALHELERISMSSSKLFVKFDKHIDKVAREARSLFGSAANRPEHLQTVLSELNRIGSEVDHAALTLQEKIASVSDKCRRDGEGLNNEALFRFPWFSRRYLFMLTSAWNERLSAAGQAIVSMKKLASSASLRGDSIVGPNGPSTGTEELMEAMRRLRQLKEVYSQYNVTDITTVLPTIPGKQEEEFDDDFEDGDVDASIDFADGVDADVLASRRRLNNSKSVVGSSTPYGNLDRVPPNPRGQLHKTLGTQRSFDSSHIQQETMGNAQPRVTPGGAVKSALHRFFNRGGRESDPYLVDLGIFKEGRPRLEPGVNGLVVPVVDEQLCTVIAYSLASSEYARQFKSFSKMENITEVDEAGRPVDAPMDPQLPSPSNNASRTGATMDEKKSIEQRMLVRNKSHIKHTFRDYDEKGTATCKFVCTTYWATQFHAVRQVFLSNSFGRKDGGASSAGGSLESDSCVDVEQGYVQSLSSAVSWAASGGKSGASFARTADDRFVIKCISRTELQMFLDCAPAYFEYLSKAFFHGLPTVLCKIVGVYQIGYHNRETGKRSMEQVAVMQNIFYDRKISRVFDLKGSLRGRFAAQVQSSKEESVPETPPLPLDTTASNHASSDFDSASRALDKVAEKYEAEDNAQSSNSKGSSSKTQLDGDFLEFTRGRPMPLADRAKSLFHMSIQNDTLFLSIINVLDYSILVGVDEEKEELVVGIIDFMRQYDILKQMERVGKSLPMVVGSEAPTIIQPPLYKARFTNAMERYFMTVPCKWTTI